MLLHLIGIICRLMELAVLWFFTRFPWFEKNCLTLTYAVVSGAVKVKPSIYTDTLSILIFTQVHCCSKTGFTRAGTCNLIYEMTFSPIICVIVLDISYLNWFLCRSSLKTEDILSQSLTPN